jgi:hypothetical protein
MILNVLFLLLVVICIGILIYKNKEKYNLGELDKLSRNNNQDNQDIQDNYGLERKNIKKRLTGGAKYDYGSDYDKIKQKRSIGSIRTTGEDS